MASVSRLQWNVYCCVCGGGGGISMPFRVTKACSDERLPAAYDGKIYCSVGIDPDNVFLWCRYVVMMVTKKTRGLLGLISSHIYIIYF